MFGECFRDFRAYRSIIVAACETVRTVRAGQALINAECYQQAAADTDTHGHLKKKNLIHSHLDTLTLRLTHTHNVAANN